MKHLDINGFPLVFFINISSLSVFLNIHLFSVQDNFYKEILQNRDVKGM